MADLLTSFFQNLNELGFYNFLLPWLFTFAIVYGLLMKANLFGEANKKVSVALAFVIAFFVTGFAGPAMAAFFISIFGGASIFLAGILVIILFLAMVGWVPPGDKKRGWTAAVAILVVIGVVLFIVSTGTFATNIMLNETTIAAIFVIVILGLAMWFITQEKSAEGAKPATAPGPAHH
ncbi:MAG: hypothetical protein HZB67_06200 [Candidatus Aenigmarchaeota archaeon]|nr:hypothetical protein [Candidatus Aenigmarchaeota archaeon]